MYGRSCYITISVHVYVCAGQRNSGQQIAIFVTNLVYFRGGMVGISTLNVLSFAFPSLCCNFLLILILISCIYSKFVLRPRLG